MLVHGSGNADLTLANIEIVRSSGQKQGKKGRVYGGFYTLAQQDIEKAENYAKMMDGSSPTLYNIKIKNGTKLYQTDRDVTRLSPDTINELVKDGFGVLVGKDPRGHTEWVVIDKDCIASVSKRG
ncbi:hypothetical protein [Acinetobacter sp.]|uniref:hypothetical protein n=1 Tax=Acinetobacter sp. TaxID=472 RepID=UPI003891004E